MTEDDAFLAGIIDRPDDDGLRLDYAALLEEKGRRPGCRQRSPRRRLPVSGGEWYACYFTRSRRVRS